MPFKSAPELPSIRMLRAPALTCRNNRRPVPVEAGAETRKRQELRPWARKPDSSCTTSSLGRLPVCSTAVVPLSLYCAVRSLWSFVHWGNFIEGLEFFLSTYKKQKTKNEPLCPMWSGSVYFPPLCQTFFSVETKFSIYVLAKSL